MPAGKALNKVARLRHEDNPVILDENKQAGPGPNAELLARFLRDDDLILAAQRDGRGHRWQGKVIRTNHFTMRLGGRRSLAAGGRKTLYATNPRRRNNR